MTSHGAVLRDASRVKRQRRNNSYHNCRNRWYCITPREFHRLILLSYISIACNLIPGVGFSSLSSTERRVIRLRSHEATFRDSAGNRRADGIQKFGSCWGNEGVFSRPVSASLYEKNKLEIGVTVFRICRVAWWNDYTARTSSSELRSHSSLPQPELTRHSRLTGDWRKLREWRWGSRAPEIRGRITCVPWKKHGLQRGTVNPRRA